MDIHEARKLTETAISSREEARRVEVKREIEAVEDHIEAAARLRSGRRGINVRNSR